jgi:hypothetical protein
VHYDGEGFLGLSGSDDATSNHDCHCHSIEAYMHTWIQLPSRQLRDDVLWRGGIKGRNSQATDYSTLHRNSPALGLAYSVVETICEARFKRCPAGSDEDMEGLSPRTPRAAGTPGKACGFSF